MNTNTIVDYTDTPFSKITIKKEFIKEIYDYFRDNVGTTKKTPIAKKWIGHIEPRSIGNFFEEKTINVDTFNKIVEYCKISKTKAEKGISSIDNIKNPNIPLKFDCKEGARLDAGIFNEGRIRNRSIEYHNKDREILKIVLNCSKKIIGTEFNPTISIDTRSGTYCMYFPPYFVKHYVKLKVSEIPKNKLKTGVPDYIFNNELYQKVWWRANLSEESSIYPNMHYYPNKKYYIINPRIQLNRVKQVDFRLDKIKPISTLYYKDIPKNVLNKLISYKHPLLEDEIKMLNNFNIGNYTRFSKLYINKNLIKTATYSLLVYKIQDLETFLTDIGFELYRQKRQLKLLLNNREIRNKEGVRDIFIKFYKLIPTYLRTNNKIMENKYLTKEDKLDLIGDENDKTNNFNTYGQCGFWEVPYNRYTKKNIYR